MVGCGAITTAAHLPAIGALAPLLRLVGVADIRAEAARAVAQAYGGVRWTTDYRTLLADRDVRMVIICTPETLHAEQVEAAADAGKHVLCEKPMASSLPETDRMIAAAERNNVLLMIGHSRRFTRRYSEAKRLVDEGRIGKVTFVRENERRSAATGRPAGQGQWFPEGNRPWGALRQYTRGVAMTGAVHEMDLFRWFMQDDVARVMAQARIVQADRGLEVPDYLSYLVEFHQGGRAAGEFATFLPPGYPAFHQLEIQGTEGVLRAYDTQAQVFAVHEQQGMAFPVASSTLLHVEDAYVRQLRAFINAVRRESPPPITTGDARAALEAALAADMAATRGRPVTLPLTGDSRAREDGK